MSALPIETDLPADQSPSCNIQSARVGGHPLDPGQCRCDAHLRTAGVESSSGSGQRGDVAHETFARAGDLPADQTELNTQPSDVGGQLLDPGHVLADTHSGRARVEPSQPDPTKSGPIPKNASSGLADALLLIYSDALDDLEGVRIATANRIRALRDVKGLDGTPEEQRLTVVLEGIGRLEHEVELDLARALRKHPLGPWVKRTVGIGEKQGARLLAAIGDPYWHSAQDRPRTVSELWAYCGYHVVTVGHCSGAVQMSTADGHVLRPDHYATDVQSRFVGADPSSDTDHPRSDTSQAMGVGVAPFRRRGQKANWNNTAKMRAFLVAESCVKQRHSPYRVVYDTGRAKYVDALHQLECRRCGPSGKPASVGSPLSDGHKHARALRLVAKAVLRDLWIESRALHEMGRAS